MISVRQTAMNLTRIGIILFVEAARQAVARDAQRHGRNVDAYLNERGLRGDFRRATNVEQLIKQQDDGTYVVNSARVDLLLSCLRKLDIPVQQLVSNDMRSHPWDLFCEGDALAMVLGSKLVEGPVMCQFYISTRDMDAKREFHEFLHDCQHLEFRPCDECLSIETSPEEAEAALREWQSRRNLGMIVAIGSPVVNPLAVPMARAILKNAGLRSSPAWFEWPVSPKTLGFTLPKRPLIFKQTQACGVRLRSPVQINNTEERSWFPRVGRYEALRRFQQGDRGPFEDSGLLMLDVQSRPMLALVAGHGGCGTQAALRALLDEETISRELADSHDGASILGPGRLMQVVEARCTKRTLRANVDDLEFGPNDWCAYTLRPAGYAPREEAATLSQHASLRRHGRNGAA